MNRREELVHIRATYYDSDSRPGADGHAIIWPHLLTDEQVEIEATPLWCGATITIWPKALTAYIADGDWHTLLKANAEILWRILDRIRPTIDCGSVGVVTVWACEAGTSYIPGEPDEYDEDAQLIGYLDPTSFRVVLLEE